MKKILFFLLFCLPLFSTKKMEFNLKIGVSPYRENEIWIENDFYDGGNNLGFSLGLEMLRKNNTFDYGIGVEANNKVKSFENLSYYYTPFYLLGRIKPLKNKSYYILSRVGRSFYSGSDSFSDGWYVGFGLGKEFKFGSLEILAEHSQLQKEEIIGKKSIFPEGGLDIVSIKYSFDIVRMSKGLKTFISGDNNEKPSSTDVDNRPKEKEYILIDNEPREKEYVLLEKKERFIIDGYSIYEIDLRSEQKNKLDQIAKKIKDKKGVILLISYTDSSGSEELNKDLSEKRAERIKEYLSEKLGETEQLKYIVYPQGAKKFIFSNEGENGRRLNRRVEIVLIED